MKTRVVWLLSLIAILSLLVAACATPEPQIVEKTVKETVVVQIVSGKGQAVLATTSASQISVHRVDHSRFKNSVMRNSIGAK